MTIKLNARGVERVIDRFQRLSDTTRVEEALDRAAAIVERDAVAHSPVDTGQMRSSVYVDKPAKLVRVVGSDSRQSVFTEYSPLLLKGATVANPRRGPWPYESDGKLKGTNPNATMPWLRPALYRNKRRILDLIQRALRERR